MLTVNREEIEEGVRRKLSSKRFQHTQRVTEMALKLAGIHKINSNKVWLAAMLHDYAKDTPIPELMELLTESGYHFHPAELSEKALLHAPAAAILAETELGITDKDILDAIRYHTTGYPGMGKMAKIIYIADAAESGRRYQGVEKIRETASRDLRKALLISLQSTIGHLLEAQAVIHPVSVEARNYFLNDTYRLNIK